MNVARSLSTEFWSLFVEEHWEKHPTVIQKPFAAPLMTAEEIFNGLRKASDLARGGCSNPPRFVAGQALLVSPRDIARLLPTLDERSLADYVDRLAVTLAERHFQVIANEFQQYDASVWLRLREFLRPLARLVPVLSADAVAFLGKYENTPAGVHVDPCSNFTFVLQGSKRMLAWPAEALDAKVVNDANFDYRQCRDQAIVLDGEPGDILYWPSSYWHIAEGLDDGLTATLSLGIRTWPLPIADVWHESASALPGQSVGTWQIAPGQLLDNPNEIAGAVTRAVGATLEIAPNVLKASWLNRLTSGGFSKVPPALPEERVGDGDLVCGDQMSPIVWMAMDDDEMVVSANGHSFFVPSDPRLVELVERLNRGACFRAYDLIRSHVGTTTLNGVEFELCPEDVRKFLTTLRSVRAINVLAPQAVGNGSESTETCCTESLIGVCQ